jgi:hypothetical protein
VRGPLAVFAYVLPRLIAQSPVAVHGFDLACAALTAFCTAGLTVDLINNATTTRKIIWPGVLAGALYWLMYAGLNYWSTAQAEGFANLFIVAGLWCGWRAINREPWEAEIFSTRRFGMLVLLAGASCAVALWFKYPFVLYGVVLAGFIAAWSPLARGHSVVLFGLAALAVVLIGLAYFFLAGALDAFWAHIEYDFATFHAVPLDERWRWLTDLFWLELTTFVRVGSTPTAGFKATVPQVEFLGRGYPFIWLMALASAMLLLALRQHRRAGVFALVYLVLGLLVNVWQGHSYRYHFIVWLPALAVLAGAGLGALLLRPMSSRWGWGLLGSYAVCAALALAGLIATMLPWLSDAATNWLVLRKPIREIYIESKEADYVRVAEFLAQHTTPADTVLVFSDVPAVYVLSNRRNATRFPYLRWAQEAGSAAIRQHYAQQFYEDFVRNRPKYFVLTKDGYLWPEAKFGALLKTLPESDAYFQQHYHYVTDVGQFVVFEKR